MKVYYYLYQITNLVNGKIYVGVHRTDNLKDGYMGSGVYLKRAQQKHGIENFEKKLLQFFENEKDMYSAESYMVDISFVSRKDTYNLAEGGYNVGQASLGGMSTFLNKKGLFSEKARIGLKAYFASPIAKENRKIAVEASKSIEARTKRKEAFKRAGHSKGEKNSQYGTMWITNGEKSKKILRDGPIPLGYKKGRVVKMRSKLW